MSRLQNGLRKAAGGWKDPFYRSKPKPVAVVLTEEQTAERQAEYDRWIADCVEKMQLGNRGLTKLVDREARVAVEGDTDLNHDNVEAGE